MWSFIVHWLWFLNLASARFDQQFGRLLLMLMIISGNNSRNSERRCLLAFLLGGNHSLWHDESTRIFAAFLWLLAKLFFVRWWPRGSWRVLTESRYGSTYRLAHEFLSELMVKAHGSFTLPSRAGRIFCGTLFAEAALVQRHVLEWVAIIQLLVG